MLGVSGTISLATQPLYLMACTSEQTRLPSTYQSSAMVLCKYTTAHAHVHCTAAILAHG